MARAKGTLVNSVFKKKIAEAGAGRPTTKGIQEYNNSYLIVYDSEGYESGAENQQRYSELIYNFLQCKNENPLTAVHIGWYCLSAPSARFTELDAELVKKTSKFMPLAVVLTKIDLATEEQVAALTKAIKEQCPAISIFLSTTEDIPLENDLNMLEKWSKNHLPEMQRKSFISVSNRNIDEKENEGDKIIHKHVAAAFATGFLPIPLSDAPALIANQTALLGRLCVLWDMEHMEQVVSTSLAGSGIMTLIGKSLSGNILKFIPGIGQIAGGMINGSVASALTFSLGTAINKLLRKITEDQLSGKNTPFSEYITEDFLSSFVQIFTQNAKQ